MVLLPLIRQTESPYLVSCKQQMSTFCPVSISTISLALPLIFPTFTVSKLIPIFPAASCTNNSFHIWHSFYSVLEHKILQSGDPPDKNSLSVWQLPENWAFLLKRPSHQKTHKKNSMQHAKLFINTKSKGTDLRHPTLV